MSDEKLRKDAENGRMLRRKIEVKLKEIGLELRACEMEERALRAEIALERINEGPRGFAERAKDARKART